MTLKLKWLLIKYFSSLLCMKLEILRIRGTKAILKFYNWNKCWVSELYPLVVSFEPDTKTVFICSRLASIPPLSKNSNWKVIQNPACSIQSFRAHGNINQKHIEKPETGQKKIHKSNLMNSNSYYITKHQLQYIYHLHVHSIFIINFFFKILCRFSIQNFMASNSTGLFLPHMKLRKKKKNQLRWHQNIRQKLWIKCYPIDKGWGNRCPPYILSFQCDHLEEPPPNFLHCSQFWRVCNTSSSSSHTEAESL